MSSTESTTTDCGRLALQLQAQFTSDPRGRLLACGIPDPAPPPRFLLGRTRHGNLWRFRGDVVPDVVRAVSRLIAREPALAGLESSAPAAPPAPPEREAACRALLGIDDAEHTRWCGPAFAFDAGPAADRALGSLAEPAVALAQSASSTRAADLEAEFPDARRALDAGMPCFAIFDAGAPVSVCFSARAAPGLAHEAGVRTRVEARGNGHAPRAVAAWALAIRARGEVPLYSTQWKNRASRRVAAKLGLSAYAEILHYA